MSKKTSKIIRKYFQGLSLKRSTEFIPNLVLVLGAIFIWRGVWNMIDIYLFPNYPDISQIVSILIGVFLVYLPDGSFKQLGQYKLKKK